MHKNQIRSGIECSGSSEREKALEGRFEELVSNVITYIPHELRTPLVSIMGFTQIIMDELNTIEKDDLRFMIRNIDRSSKRLYATVEKFIGFAEIECISKDEKMKREIESKNGYAHTAAAMDAILFLAEKTGRGDDLIMNIEDAELAIPDHYLKLISKELFDNALKFSKEGLKIEVTGKRCLDSYRMEIKDHGIGITKEDISRIDPFRQFNRKSLQQDGNGLGLAIVKRIAEVFNCVFRIDSQKDIYTVVSIDFKYRTKNTEEL